MPSRLANPARNQYPDHEPCQFQNEPSQLPRQLAQDEQHPGAERPQSRVQRPRVRAGVPDRKRGNSELPAAFKAEGTLPFSGDGNIHWTFEVKEGCPWTFDFDDCLRYLKNPVDGCNCGDENGKQGGYGENNCQTWMFDSSRS
jgi:hypothetical protein